MSNGNLKSQTTVLLGGGRVGNLLGEEFLSLHPPAKEADLGEDSLPLSGALPPIKGGEGLPLFPTPLSTKTLTLVAGLLQVAAALGFLLAAELGISQALAAGQ